MVASDSRDSDKAVASETVDASAARGTAADAESSADEAVATVGIGAAAF